MADNTPGVGGSTKSMLQSLSQYAPDAIKALSGTAPDTARTLAGIDKELAPQYNQLYKEGQLSSSGTEADIAEGPGKRLVTAADESQKQLDPEFYKSRGIVGNAINSYLGSYDPNHLSPTETAEISRGINATTGPMTPSNLSTVKNAQTFGSALTNRWQGFGDAITKASTALPSLKSGISSFNTSQSRGANPLPSNSSTALGSNMGFANNALGNISANQRAIMGINDSNSPIKLAEGAVSSY